MILKFKDYYYCSEDGIVYSKYTGKLKPIKPFVTKGYSRVILVINKKRKHYLVHSIIAEVFLPKVYGKNALNHKDGKKHNNSIENLEWCTLSENSLHCYKNNLRDLPNRKLTSEQVKDCRYMKSVGFKLTDIMRKYSISNSTASEIVNYKRYKQI
jgi:hypothetical protein